MAQQFINTGSAVNTLTSDTLRDAMVKTEDNFIELYDLFPIVLFPHTSSANFPTEIVGGPNGENATLGVTGSVDITEHINTPTIFFHPTTYDSSYISNRSFLPSKSNITIYNQGTTPSEYYYFNVRYFSSFGLTSHLAIGQEFGNDYEVRINGNGYNNRYFIINGTGGYLIGGGTSQGNRVAVKINATNATKDFEVNGELLGSEYFSSLPTSDPEVGGQWFTTSSKAVGLQDNNIDVICISQGL